MTPQMTNYLVWLLILSEVADVLISLAYGRGSLSRERLEAWQYAYSPVIALLCFVIAVGLLVQDQYALTGLYAFAASMRTYKWWHNDRHKRKRRKLLDRMAGRVRDVGGKLKVVQPVASS